MLRLSKVIRAKENMDPIDGGNEYFVPMNMVPLRRALEEPKDPEPLQIPTKENTDEGNEDEEVV